MSASAARLADGSEFDARRASFVLAILAGMALMVTYVETMVLPAFAQFYSFFDQTGGSFALVTWILSAYLLVGVIVTPIFGKLGDLYGKKRMLLVAMSIYAGAVTVAGFTPNIGAALGIARPEQIYVLIGVRAVQGIGMAMFPLGFAMIPEVFPPRRVGQAQGIVSAMFGAGAALGLVGGGFIAQTYGWQLTYHTVIPAAILLVLLAAFFLTESPRRADRSLDLPGVASLGAALTFLMFGVSEASSWGWVSVSAAHLGPLPWGTPQFFLLSLLAFAFFVLWEPRARSPVIQFASLRRRNILVSNVNGILIGLVMFFIFTADTILIEYPYGPGFDQGELAMGLLTLPAALAMLATGTFLGRAVARFGPRPISILGFLLISAASGLLVLFNRSLWEMVVLPIPLFIGNVAVLIAMSNTIVLSAERHELGVQTGMNQTFRNLGSAAAPVLVASILASFPATYLLTVSTPAGPALLPVSGLYSLEGFRIAFAVTAILGLVGLFVSLALRNFRYTTDGARIGHDDRAAPAAAIPPGPVVRTPAPLPVPDPAAGSG
ncbi:MAG: MFS transporter [Thermoplasmata archaeon]